MDGRAEMSKEEIPGSQRGMHGYILTYSRLIKMEPSFLRPQFPTAGDGGGGL